MPGQVLRREGVLEPHPAAALAGLLDLPAGPPADATLPPMWHCAYLHDVWRQSELGIDGHPTAGVPAPPAAGYRRMFAGGWTRHLEPLRLGRPAVRQSQVVSSVEKQGRSGALLFVTVRHEIAQDGRTAVIDEHDIVYRQQVTTGDPPLPLDVETPATELPPHVDRFDFAVDPVVLFRFSALTSNAHRIHYDRPYGAVEGYPDLVIHGPLQIVLMAESLRRAGQSIVGRAFAYRLVAPSFGAQRLTVVRREPDPTDEAGLHSVVEVYAEHGGLVARGRLKEIDPPSGTAS